MREFLMAFGGPAHDDVSGARKNLEALEAYLLTYDKYAGAVDRYRLAAVAQRLARITQWSIRGDSCVAHGWTVNAPQAGQGDVVVAILPYRYITPLLLELHPRITTTARRPLPCRKMPPTTASSDAFLRYTDGEALYKRLWRADELEARMKAQLELIATRRS